MEDKTQIKQKNTKDVEMLASIPVLASNSIVLLDGEGTIIWANKGFENLHGFSYDDKNSNSKVESLDFIKKIKDTDSNFFLQNRSMSFSYSFVSEHLGRKWVQATLTPVIEDSKVIQYISIGVDITQQKEVEDELIQRQENTLTLSEHLESINDHIEDKIEELNKQKELLQNAKDRSENVLNKVIPYEVAVQLKQKGYATPRHYKKVSVLYFNIRNFNQLAEDKSVDELIEILHECFVNFDNILEEHYVEKIKTVGGIYIGVGGVPLRNRSNPIDVVLAALKIKKQIEIINHKFTQKQKTLFNTGIGINTGKAIAGVVGKNRISYDVWGDTVNATPDVEKHAPDGGIMVSDTTHREIAEFFDCSHFDGSDEYSGGKYWLVNGIKPEFTDDKDGIIPGENMLKILSKL